MSSISDLSLFAHTARLGSITAAAQHLQITVATASAALKRLEQQLGCLLFIRSTRHLKLTTEGELYLQHCQNALAALELGAQALQQTRQEHSGVLRLAAPSDLGRNWLLPLLDVLQQQFPQLKLRLELADRVAGLRHESVDVALRYGSAHDPSMVVLPIAQVPRVICASPAYLQRMGTPSSALELSSHNALLYHIDDRPYDRWQFQTEQGLITVNVSGNRMSNDADLVRRWCVAGHGIALKSMLDMAADLKHGHVVALTHLTPSPPLQLSLVCASRHQISAPVQQLRHLLQQHVEHDLRLASIR